MHFSLGDACKRIKEHIQSKLYFLKISNAQLYFGTMLKTHVVVHESPIPELLVCLLAWSACRTLKFCLTQLLLYRMLVQAFRNSNFPGKLAGWQIGSC